MKTELLNEAAVPEFCGMFADYYAEMECDEDTGHLLDEYVLADYRAGLIKIAAAEEGGRVVGFVIWQVDSPGNEWCLREGLGTVRELYVRPGHRGRGVGSALADYAEDMLLSGGAARVYALPAEGTQGFFLARGYAEADEYCEETDCNFFYKEL